MRIVFDHPATRHCVVYDQGNFFALPSATPSLVAWRRRAPYTGEMAHIFVRADQSAEFATLDMPAILHKQNGEKFLQYIAHHHTLARAQKSANTSAISKPKSKNNTTNATPSTTTHDTASSNLNRPNLANIHADGTSNPQGMRTPTSNDIKKTKAPDINANTTTDIPSTDMKNASTQAASTQKVLPKSDTKGDAFDAIADAWL